MVLKLTKYNKNVTNIICTNRQTQEKTISITIYLQFNKTCKYNYTVPIAITNLSIIKQKWEQT